MDIVIALVIGATILGGFALQAVVSIVEALSKRDARRIGS
jgi:hypothetical protein